MPKDEFDFDDPMELNGVGVLTAEDTTDAMGECFIEEFLRLGHDARQVLALFRNPYHLGMNLVLLKRGEPFVRGQIEEIFARWGRRVDWSAPPAPSPSPLASDARGEGARRAGEGSVDPLGGTIPAELHEPARVRIANSQFPSHQPPP